MLEARILHTGKHKHRHVNNLLNASPYLLFLPNSNDLCRKCPHDHTMTLQTVLCKMVFMTANLFEI